MAVADAQPVGAPAASTPFKVLWRDADPAGWILYASVTRYFDEAETALFEDLGLVYHEELERGRGYPRVHFECDFKSPLRVHDRGTAHASIRRLGRSSIVVGFTLVKDGDEQPCVTGEVTMVVIDWRTGRPSGVPDELRRRVEAAGC
jgi:acyl-CoA thioester hydrolase